MGLRLRDSELNDRLVPEVDETGEYVRSKVDAERLRAQGEEDELRTAIGAEETRATQAEEDLQADITAETQRATQAETTLQTNIDKKLDKVTTPQDGYKVYAVSPEGSQTLYGASQAATGNTIAIREATSGSLNVGTPTANTHATTKQYVDAAVAAVDEEAVALQQELTEEIQRATQAESALQTSIENEVSRAQAKEAEIEDDLSAEVTRATQAEQANATAISQEASRAQEAESGLQGAITSETSRATGVEQGLNTRLTTVEGKIPNQASAQNQLADKAFVNSSINSAAAFFRGNFETKAALDSWQTSNPGVATNNDYAYVESDETHDGEAWRYIFIKEGEYPGAWEPQFMVNETPFTAEQLAAINSGATAEIITGIGNKLDKVSTTGNNRVYGISSQGTQVQFDVISGEATADSLVARSTNGTVVVGTPTQNSHATTKAYVDSAVQAEEDRAVAQEQALSSQISAKANSSDVSLLNQSQSFAQGVSKTFVGSTVNVQIAPDAGVNVGTKDETQSTAVTSNGLMFAKNNKSVALSLKSEPPSNYQGYYLPDFPAGTTQMTMRTLAVDEEVGVSKIEARLYDPYDFSTVVVDSIETFTPDKRIRLFLDCGSGDVVILEPIKISTDDAGTPNAADFCFEVPVDSSEWGDNQGKTFILSCPSSGGTMHVSGPYNGRIGQINNKETVTSFYAPETAGTSGQVLTSTGNGAPTWQNMPDIPVIIRTSGTLSGGDIVVSSDSQDTMYGVYYGDITLPANCDVWSTRFLIKLTGESYSAEIFMNNRQTSPTNLRVYLNERRSFTYYILGFPVE